MAAAAGTTISHGLIEGDQCCVIPGCCESAGPVYHSWTIIRSSMTNFPNDTPTDPHAEPHPSRNRTKTLGAVAAGGAVGGLLRFGVSHLLPRSPAGFPWATLLTNISGSFLLALVVTLVVRRFPSTHDRLLFFATGVLGTYTTFSTLAVEIDLLIANGHSATAGFYLLASLAIGLLAAWAGILTAGSRRDWARF